MKSRLFLSLLLLLAGYALAQGLTSDEILANLTTTADSLQDASFLLTGRLIDSDGTEIALEIEIEFIPKKQIARAYILQPDALADNFIVLDGDSIYNYIFLTNQITIFKADDPDALGGLIPQGDGSTFEVTLDLDTLFAGWQTGVESYLDTPAGPAYQLRFDNLDSSPDVLIDHVTATVIDESWIPYQLVFYQEDGSVLAELKFEDFIRDQGLDPAEITYLPEDAEIIDERR